MYYWGLISQTNSPCQGLYAHVLHHPSEVLGERYVRISWVWINIHKAWEMLLSLATFYLAMQYIEGKNREKKPTQILPHAEQFIGHHYTHVPIPKNSNTGANR